MRIEPQTNEELAQLDDLVEDIPGCMLTNHDAQGALISRPMAPLKMDEDGTLWFFADLCSSVVKKMRSVNVSFVDAKKGTYVSLAGHCEIDLDRKRILDMWTDAAKPWFPKGPDSIDLVLLKFVPRTAEYWDLPKSRMINLFARAAAAVSGKPVVMGEHETLTHLSRPKTSSIANADVM